MARTVTFGGITKARPGGISRVRNDNTSNAGAAPTSIAIIGEAEGGAPGSDGLVSVRDPSRVADLFKSGPLVDAALYAFQASSDPQVPGGASEVVIYKTNAGTQSGLSVHGPREDTATYTTTTNTATDTIVISGSPLTEDALIGDVILYTNAGGSALGVITDNTTSDIVFTPTSPSAIVAGSVFVIPALAAPTVAAGSTTMTVNIVGDITLVPAEIIGTQVDVQYVQSSPSTAVRRTVLSATASSVTFAYPLPAVPADEDIILFYPQALTIQSSDYGAHTNNISFDYTYTEKGPTSTGGYTVTVGFEDDEQVSPLLGETPRLDIFYGTNAGIATFIDMTVNTVNPSAVTAGNEGGNTFALSASIPASTYDGYAIRFTSGSLTETVRVFSADGAGEVEVATPGLSAEMLTALATTGTATLTQVASAAVRVNGAAGVATSLETLVTGITGPDLSIPITANMTINDLVAVINKAPGYVATTRNGINGDVELAANLDFDPEYSDISTTVSIRSTNADDIGYYEPGKAIAFWTKARGLTADVYDMVSYINEFSTYLTASRSTLTSSAGASLPFIDYGAELWNDNGTFRPIEDADGPKLLSGGTRGTSANSNFQAGFDLLLSRPIDYVVPLVDQDLVNEGNSSTATYASVSQQLLAHVTLARGRAGVERGGFMGFRGTKEEYIDALNTLNDMDVQLVSQYPTALDGDANLVAQGPRELAVMAASMRAGVNEDGLPLTHKSIRISDLTQDSTWTPGDLTDATDLILNGALFAEYVPGQGYRWVRDLTTWSRTDNITQAEGSVRDLVRKVVYALRTGIEEKFTGQKATPTTISAVRDEAIRILEEQRTLERIVDSTDVVTGETLRAYYNLLVFSEGDVVKLSVGIFPVPGINFQLNDVFVSVPTQVAS